MSGAAPGTVWSVVVTEWTLDSFLQLAQRGVLTSAEHGGVLRPDLVLLRQGLPATDPRFHAHAFWSPAKQGSWLIRGGYKMKWHQLGPLQVELRLAVTALPGQVLLCECYDKASSADERRKMARLKTQMNLIAAGRYTHRGTL
jgi:hypothetical protein